MQGGRFCAVSLETRFQGNGPCLCCSDLHVLARAAVSGDEAALDMFNMFKGKSPALRGGAGGEANCFFIGGNVGE